MIQFTQLEIKLLYKLILELRSRFSYDKAISMYCLNRPIILTAYHVRLIKRFLKENIEDPKLQELKNNISAVKCFKNLNKTTMIDLTFKTTLLVLTSNEYNLIKTIKF